MTKDNLDSNKIIIRQYCAADKESAYALHVLAMKDTNAYLGSKFDQDFENIENIYFENDGDFIIVECDGQIIAMGALMKLSASMADLRRIRVHPKFQHKGIGQLILNALEKRALELGYKALHVDTLVHQVAAQALFRKNGYVENGRTVHDGWEFIFFDKRLN